jgi:hypothetical protein
VFGRVASTPGRRDEVRTALVEQSSSPAAEWWNLAGLLESRAA